MTNEEFDDLPRWQKRVQIAKDVLAQLEVGRFREEHGTYVRYRETVAAFSSRPSTSGDVREALAGKQCQVCALGAAFVCAVERLDRFQVADLPNGNLNSRTVTSDYLAREGLFSYREIDLLERAFEGWMPFATESSIADIMGVVVDLGGSEIVLPVFVSRRFPMCPDWKTWQMGWEAGWATARRWKR